MKNFYKFHVKKRTLLAIAGTVWALAGVNVFRLGLLAYFLIEHTSVINILLTSLVFFLFGIMFYKMSVKHSKRICSYEEKTKYFWQFFDLKAYIIMTFMMSGGIWLRLSGLVPLRFIAVFYTGLGLALTFAGVYFLYVYFTKVNNQV